jgi:hypothetical protein
MKNLWTLASYPAAAIGGFFVVQASGGAADEILGLSPIANQVGILAISGLVIGFIIDEMVPAYIHEVRNRGSGGAGDMGGGDIGGDMDDGDFDFE